MSTLPFDDDKKEDLLGRTFLEQRAAALFKSLNPKDQILHVVEKTIKELLQIQDSPILEGLLELGHLHDMEKILRSKQLQCFNPNFPVPLFLLHKLKLLDPERYSKSSDEVFEEISLAVEGKQEALLTTIQETLEKVRQVQKKPLAVSVDSSDAPLLLSPAAQIAAAVIPSSSPPVVDPVVGSVERPVQTPNFLIFV